MVNHKVSFKSRDCLGDVRRLRVMPATMGNETSAAKLSCLLERMKGKPHVSIDVLREGAVSILFNDRISMEDLTEHLISEHGVRKIAFISGPLHFRVAAERIEACRNVLRRHGLTLDDRLVFDGQWTRAGGRKAAERLSAGNTGRAEGLAPSAFLRRPAGKIPQNAHFPLDESAGEC